MLSPSSSLDSIEASVTASVYNSSSFISSSSPSPLPLAHPPPPPSFSASSCTTRFTNLSFLRSHRLVSDDDLWVRDSCIIDPQAHFFDAGQRNEFAAEQEVDCDGLIMVPGYIDLQLNGAFGIDFSNPTDFETTTAPSSSSSSPPVDNLQRICEGVLSHGVTSILATIITSSPSTYDRLRPLIRRRPGSSTLGAHILGVHLEGPFITVPGAHPPSLIRGDSAQKKEQKCELQPVIENKTTTNQATAQLNAANDTTSSSSSSASSSSPSSSSSTSPPPPDLLSEVYSVYGSDLSQVDIITLAPELRGVDRVISTLSEQGIVISAGHSKASYDESVRAANKGVRLITHLFNAMTSFHHRDPGLIGLIGCTEITAPNAAAAEVEADMSRNKNSSANVISSLTSPPPPSLFYSLIVDGHHTHPASVKIAYSTHPSGCVLITDAMCAMGLKDGKYKFGEITVDIRNEMAHVDGTNTLAGSIATMEKCVQNFRLFTGCSFVSAIECATLHPAQCLRLRQKGALDFGMDADMMLVDREMNVKAVWVMGKMAWKKNDCNIKVKKVSRINDTHA